MPTATTKYDTHFKVQSHIFFAGEVSWLWMKALGIAESNLDPDAVSSAGAIGIMQLMPATSEEVARERWLPNAPYDPKVNILLGISYAKKMWDIFQEEEYAERLCFMFAAYNAGWGNIVKAQKIARDIGTKPYIWTNVAAVLHRVTGPHARETIQHVERIISIKQTLDEEESV